MLDLKEDGKSAQESLEQSKALAGRTWELGASLESKCELPEARSRYQRYQDGPQEESGGVTSSASA